MTVRIDKFNQLVGYIFDDLYNSFPVAERLDLEKMARRFDVESERYVPNGMVISLRSRIYGDLFDGVNFETFFDNTLTFLVSEGFVYDERGEMRLTSKALTILNAPMEGLGISRGSRLHEAVKEVGHEARKSAVSEVVGSIIGAAVKGLIS